MSLSTDHKQGVCRQRAVKKCSVTNLNMVAFKPRSAGSGSEFAAWPIRVDFHELLQRGDSPPLVPEVENLDILSAVVALYDVSFPELGTDEVYNIVSSPDSQTIVLLRSHTDVLEEYRGGRPTGPPGAARPPAESGDGASEKGRFCEVFSDSDDSSNEAEDSAETAEDRSGWETFSSGVTGFLSRALERRAARHRAYGEQDIPPSAVGAESLIVAAATYKLRRLEIGEKALELSLLTTRRRYRGCGVGTRIVELLKSPAVCGPYDVLLAHAESSAVDFFTKCGLTDDPLLNDKFKEVRDEWTNATLMSYLTPFSIGPTLDLWEVEVEVDLMRKRALLAYQQQAVCVTRLVQEVSALRGQLLLQAREVNTLKMKLDIERSRRFCTEQEFLEYKLMTSQQLMERPSRGTDEQDYRAADDTEAESAGTTEEGPCRAEEWPEIRQPSR